MVEEYIQSQTCGSALLPGKQLHSVVWQLCSVLEFLHGKGIIHRDIKPSNILLTEDGRLYLIDFDAARMPKEDQEQDTRLLGTRGFAPPEQYGFSQTDERTDIYALGATLQKILGEKAQKMRFKKIIRKCMNLDSDRRYQSVRQVRRAFFHRGRDALCVLGNFFSDWYHEEKVRISGYDVREKESHIWNLESVLKENGYYYFSIAAVGNGYQYGDSPYMVSDVFEYTGESAPPLPSPVGLEWKELEIDDSRQYFAVWSNLDEYEDKDTFNVTLYDKTGAYVMNNTWSKEMIQEQGYGGIKVTSRILASGLDCAYRFTVQVYSSRPNEYRSSLMPDPPPEEYYSPWLYYGPQSDK